MKAVVPAQELSKLYLNRKELSKSEHLVVLLSGGFCKVCSGDSFRAFFIIPSKSNLSGATKFASGLKFKLVIPQIVGV